MTASKQVLEKIGAADATRSKGQDEGAAASQIEDTLARVIEQARKLAESEDFQDKEKKELGGKDLQRQVEKLLNSLIRSKNGIDKDDYRSVWGRGGVASGTGRGCSKEGGRGAVGDLLACFLS